MTVRTLVPIAAAAVALLASGCGDDDSSSGGNSSATPAPQSADGEARVRIKDIKFDPKTVTVKVDQKIIWTNLDGIAHNVTAEEGADFQSKNLSQGDTFEFTPEAAGTIKYVCTIHPGQDGEIIVTS